jgi:hypothetical protein
MPQNTRKEEESELRPTSSPPEDVEIPTDSIYGSNEPLEPIEEENDAPIKEIREVDSSPDSSQTKTKSIKIGWLPFLLFLIMLGAGLFALGVKIAPQVNPKLLEAAPKETTKTEKPRKTINFITDSGIYKTENTYDSEKLARLRLGKAKSSVLWITSEPNNEGLLSALVDAKEEKGLPIVIVTGGETSRERIQRAKNKGFVVNQIPESLETPYSYLIVDSKLLMDLSRKHWLWETTDKETLKDTSEWLENLTKNAKIVN